MLIPRVYRLKILIILLYYNRPLLLCNALRSVALATQNYTNWTMTVLDDGSEIPAEPVVNRFFGSKIPILNTNMSIEDKIRDGIGVGKIANQVLSSSDADIYITLCDDDQIHPAYFRKLNRFFLKNNNCKYCYSQVNLYNPLLKDIKLVDNVTGPYNQHHGSIDCYGKVDSSQVACRLSTLRDANIWYRDTTKSSDPSRAGNPWIYNLDGEMFKELSRKVGKACETGFISQYKGCHEQQLVLHKENKFKSHEDIREYHKSTLARANKDY